MTHFTPSRPVPDPETCSLCRREISENDLYNGKAGADLIAGWYPLVARRWCAAKITVCDGGRC